MKPTILDAAAFAVWLSMLAAFIALGVQSMPGWVFGYYGLVGGWLAGRGYSFWQEDVSCREYAKRLLDRSP